MMCDGTQNTVGRLGYAPVFLVLIPLLTGAKSECGSREAHETLTSPVQAVGTLLERADGAVDASLVIISSAGDDSFVDEAEDVTMRMPDGERVELVLSGPGHYTASSEDDAALVYEGGATYNFRFTLDDGAAGRDGRGGTFNGNQDAPDDEVSAELSDPPMFAGDSAAVSWEPAGRYGLVRVLDAGGEVVFESFDFGQPRFDGSKWARLERGDLEFSTDVFMDAGQYTIEVCAVDKAGDFDTELDASLGVGSGFLIGRCAEPISLDVPE
jgi:hypothetical protein